MSGGLTPESWSRIERLFEEALARPDSARAAFLADACGDDAAEIEALLEAHASTEGPLERLVAGLGSPGIAGLDPDDRSAGDWTGRSVGPYTVVREIGRGGMGTV